MYFITKTNDDQTLVINIANTRHEAEQQARMAAIENIFDREDTPPDINKTAILTKENPYFTDNDGLDAYLDVEAGRISVTGDDDTTVFQIQDYPDRDIIIPTLTALLTNPGLYDLTGKQTSQVNSILDKLKNTKGG